MDEHHRSRLDDFNDIPDMSITEEMLLAEAARRNAPPDSWTPINLAQLADKPPVQPTLGNIGLVYPGKRHVFSGPQESAKTLAAYTIGILVIRQGHTIIVIDFEMGQWEARDRLRELGCTHDELAAIHYIEPHEPATQDRIDTLVTLEPALVIVDAAAGAYDIQGLDDNKRSDVERFTRIYVQAFWRANIATIVLDHVVKNTDNRGNYAIGSERKVGGTDVHLGFHPVVPIKRGSTGIYKITTHKDRGGYLQRGRLADMHIASDPETHQMTVEFKEVEHHDDGDDFRPTKLMERVSRWLQEEGGAHSGNQIEKTVEGKNDYIRQAVRRLVEEGFVGKNETGRGYEYSHILSYHVTDDIAPEEQPIQDETDFAPTSPHLAPDEVSTTSPLAPLSTERGEVERRSEIDVYDPAVQAMLDYDNDIPF